MTAVVLDTDLGTDIDDTWALAMLLGCPELDLRLVVTATGDTTYRARIAAGVLAAGGRDDVPVAIGIPTALADGIPPEPQGRFAAEIDLDRYRGGVRKDGVEALVECVMASKEPITIIGIGPMTNIAAALELEPAIAERARLVGMLGWVGDEPIQGWKGPQPEYNVASDVPACRAAFEAGWETTITPIDTCGSIVLRGERYRAVRSAASPLAHVVLRNYKDWFDVWAEARGSDWEDSLERDELGDSSDAVRARQETPFWERSSTTLFDTVAVYLAYDESLLNIERLPIALDAEGLMTVTAGSPELRVATSWRDRDRFMDHLVERLTT
jgi:inosine-uridine nucleoside N-ribohydrolase